MIGHIARAYEQGRVDARAGVKKPRSWFMHQQRGRNAREFYCLGWVDETRRMAEMGRLAQLRLPLLPQDHDLTSPAAPAPSPGGGP